MRFSWFSLCHATILRRFIFLNTWFPILCSAANLKTIKWLYVKNTCAYMNKYFLNHKHLWSYRPRWLSGLLRRSRHCGIVPTKPPVLKSFKLNQSQTPEQLESSSESRCVTVNAQNGQVVAANGSHAHLHWTKSYDRMWLWRIAWRVGCGNVSGVDDARHWLR